MAASRGEHVRAGWYIVIAAFLDMFDGRIARATNTGSRFGEELDSLVDAISFGLAPALMMYFAELNHTGWDWIFVWLYSRVRGDATGPVQRRTGRQEEDLLPGLPSPAAGGTLATYYWFSQTELYQQTTIGDLPWQHILRFLMIALSFLMISNVPYPRLAALPVRNWYGAFGVAMFVAVIAGLFLLPKQFFFPLGVAYAASGVVIALVHGSFDMPSPFAESDETPEEAAAHADDDGDEADPARRRERADDDRIRRRRRRNRGARGGPDHGSPEGSTP